jgi:hypothetical protein
LGTGLGDGRESSLGAAALRLWVGHPRPGRGDGLDHVVGELAGAVGRGQALDQLRLSVAVLEREELLAVDRRTHDETRITTTR